MYFKVLLTLILCTSVLGSKESTLLDWLYLTGGKVDFNIVRPCAGCERGAFASKAFAPGDIIATVPFHSSLELGSGTSAEQAYRLLEELTLNSTLREGFKFFLKVLPGQGEVLLPEVYSDEEIRLLQTPRLVSSRKFLLGSERLVPAIDMLNHRGDPNTEYDEVDGSVVLKATKAVAAGEELLIDYKPGVLHRPDASLFLYGFVQDHEHRLLCAMDLPTYLPFNPWRRTHLEDPTVSSATPSWAEKYEYKRLASLLASMPTTEEQDLALLEGGSLDSWRQRLLVRFRLQRKRGLRLALQRMEQAWAAKSGSLGAACQSNGSEAAPAEEVSTQNQLTAHKAESHGAGSSSSAMAEEYGETKPKVEDQAAPISIKVKDQDGGEVVFKVKPTTRFEKIFNAFCQKKAVDQTQVRFVFDGARISPISTPADLDMTDGDTIDAFLEQIGGC
ncbi:hypothetical protein N2152v2_007960 [Parachlorella kessleri]